MFARTSLFSISAIILSVLLPDNLIVAIAHGSLLANPNTVCFEVLLMLLGFCACGFRWSECE